jgi:hypothetical protein
MRRKEEEEEKEEEGSGSAVPKTAHTCISSKCEGA